MNKYKREQLAQQSAQLQSSEDYEPIDRDDLGNFVEGYIRGVLATPNSDFFGDGKPFGDNYTKYDISERTLAQMIRDCLNFYWRHRAVFELMFKKGELTQKAAGRKFWNTRNGYDRGFAEEGPEAILNVGSRGFGPFRLTTENEEIDAYYPSPTNVR